MSWLCEMATAQRALPPGEPSYRWVDFEAMLADPAAAIAAQATHFGLPVDSARIDATLAGPVMRQYSKAPEHAYSPDPRRPLQAPAAAGQAPAIAEPVAWVQALAARYTSLGYLPIPAHQENQ